MSRLDQSIAVHCSPVQRRVLCALEYHHRMTAAHIQTQMQLAVARYENDAEGMRYPSRTLRVLEDKGLVSWDWYQTDDGTKAETLYSLTDRGRAVARYCYGNGGVADAR